MKSSATPAWLSAATVSPPPATETRLPSWVSAAAVFAQRNRRSVERRGLERAERTVPDQRAAGLEHVGQRFDRGRADVEDHLVGLRPRGRCRCACDGGLAREFLRHDHVIGKMDRAAGLVGAVEDALRLAGQFMLAQATCRRSRRARQGRCWPCRRR